MQQKSDAIALPPRPPIMALVSPLRVGYAGAGGLGGVVVPIIIATIIVVELVISRLDPMGSQED